MKIILKHLTNKNIEAINCTTSHIQIVEIKEIFSRNKGYRIDTINLYKSNNELYNDKEILKKEFEFEEKVLVYSVVNHFTVKVVIEYYLNNIDKIFIDMSLYASVYMLKFIIMRRLHISIKEQSLIDTTNDKILKDESTIQNIISKQNKSEILDTAMLFSNNKNLNLRLIKIGQKSPCLGLDFSFTILKNIKKINFSQEAPSFRETSDGLSLFFQCKNSKCKIYNQIFIKNLGFGKFDVIREINLIYCVKCKFSSRYIEAKNIGFVNCEWCYKGVLISNGKPSNISGDGVTVDNKLYVLNETNLKLQFEKLDILTKESCLNYEQSNVILNDSEDDIFDDIVLDERSRVYENDNQLSEFSLSSDDRRGENLDNLFKSYNSDLFRKITTKQSEIDNSIIFGSKIKNMVMTKETDKKCFIY